MFRNICVLTILTVVSWLAISMQPRAEEINYNPTLDVRLKPGKNRTIISTDMMLPLMQIKDRMLFIDLRVIASGNGTYEGNAGIGYRHKINALGNDFIAGAYGFYDARRSESNNRHQQYTIGTELLGPKWRARANYYEPISGTKIVEDLPDTATLTPKGTVLIDSGITTEKGLRGYDLELGMKLPFSLESWAHVGYYEFGLGESDIDLNGYRFRHHTDVTDNFRIGWETSYDNIRGTNHFAELRYRMPLNFKKSEKYVRPKGVYKYMMEPIVRDIDIVVNQQAAAPQAAKGPNGQTEKYIFVDNTAGAGGDGTPGSPFNNIADAVTEANTKNDDNTIFVRQGDGTTANLNTGANLDENDLRLIGSGVDLRTREGLLVESATSSPHITNVAGDAVTVAADNVEVAGFFIDAPSADGIFIQNFDAANIHNNTITGAGNNGINAGYTSNRNYNVTIQSNTVGTSTLRGIIIRSFNGADVSASVINNVANNNTEEGMRIEGGAANSTLNTTLSGNTSNANGGNAGLYVLSAGTVDMTLNLNTHTSNGNTQDGALFLLGGTGTHNVDITALQTSTNTEDGISVDIQDSTNTTFTMNNSSSSSNTTDGLNVISRSNSILNFNLSNHTSSSNGAQGIEIDSDGATTVQTSDLDNVTASGNTGSGLILRGRTVGTLDATVSNSVFSGNTGVGALIAANNDSNVSADISASDFINANFDSLQIFDLSTGALNVDLGGGSLTSLGNNRIFGGTNFDIRANLGGLNVFAQSNWWGQASGLNGVDVNLLTGGSIDSSNYLSVDPRP